MALCTNLISVIVPVFNVELYLRRCLDSIVENTYRNLQIICIDDGSTDQSGAILDEYASKDPRFTIIHQSNGGVSSARNAGLKVACGDYISFVDSDDWIHPQFFEILIDFAEEHESKLVISDFARAYRYISLKTVDAAQVEAMFFGVEKLFAMGNIKRSVWGKLYQAELVRGLSFNEQISFSEDKLFNIDMICRFTDFSICYIKYPLYYYYDRPVSLAHIGSMGDIFTSGAVMFEYAKHRPAAPVVKSLLLKQATKDFLSARYEASVMGEPRETIKKSNAYLRTCLREMLRNQCIRFSETVRYFVLYGCPRIYRMWRVKNDPTLLGWEQKWKKQRKRED